MTVVTCPNCGAQAEMRCGLATKGVSLADTLPVPIERTGPVLSAKRAAEYCGISVKTLYNLLSLRHAGDLDAAPKPYKHGQLTVFFPADLDAWLRGKLTDPEADR